MMDGWVCGERFAAFFLDTQKTFGRIENSRFIVLPRSGEDRNAWFYRKRLYESIELQVVTVIKCRGSGPINKLLGNADKKTEGKNISKKSLRNPPTYS